MVNKKADTAQAELDAIARGIWPAPQAAAIEAVRRQVAELQAQTGTLGKLLQVEDGRGLPDRSLKALAAALGAMIEQVASLSGATADALGRLSKKQRASGSER